MQPRANSNNAFTLMELLVVITIIAVLAALLMPALVAAKDRAHAAACASNLKQAGAVFATFLNDRNGFYPFISAECVPAIDPTLPPCTCDATYLFKISPSCTYPCNNTPYAYPGGTGGGVYDPNYRSGINWDPSCPPAPCWPTVWYGSENCLNHWVFQLSPYYGFGEYRVTGWSSVNYAKALRCMANPWPYPPTLRANYTALASYRMNGNMFPLTYRGNWANAGGASPGSPSGWSKMVNASDINHPSSVMLLGETVINTSSANFYGKTLPQIVWKPALMTCYVTNAVTWNPFYCDNTFLSGNEYRELQVTPRKSCNAMVGYLHNNGMNSLMVDGHVERIPKRTLQTYSMQSIANIAGYVAGSPGNIFWTDGRGTQAGAPDRGWYVDQYPGGRWPYTVGVQ